MSRRRRHQSALSTSNVALRGPWSRRRPHPSCLNAADCIGMNHTSLPRRASCIAADLVTGVDAHVDAALVIHRSRRSRSRRVLRRPHGVHASLDDRPGNVPVLARLMASPQIIQPCLQGVRHPCVTYGAYHEFSITMPLGQSCPPPPPSRPPVPSPPLPPPPPSPPF
ncbi:unnamed protein product [Closterium sp. NIES-54]